MSTHYDPSARTFTIKTKQHTPDTPGQKGKRPVMLPLALGLLSKDGHEMPLHLKVLCLSCDLFQADFVLLPVDAQGRCQAAADCGGPLHKRCGCPAAGCRVFWQARCPGLDSCRLSPASLQPFWSTAVMCEASHWPTKACNWQSPDDAAAAAAWLFSRAT